MGFTEVEVDFLECLVSKIFKKRSLDFEEVFPSDANTPNLAIQLASGIVLFTERQKL